MAPYEPVTQEILAQLEAIAPGRVTAGEDVNPDYGRDEMPIYGVHMPEAAVEVLSTEEAAAVDRAINAVLHDGYRTPDIYRGGSGQIKTTTEEMGVQTAARISK